jgi:hypothetical protein
MIWSIKWGISAGEMSVEVGLDMDKDVEMEFIKYQYID